MEKKILLGVKKFTSKKGENYCTLELEIPFNQREITNGCKGSRVESVFVPTELMDKVDTLVVGKPINIQYDVIGSKAYIIDFVSEK